MIDTNPRFLRTRIILGIGSVAVAVLLAVAVFSRAQSAWLVRHTGYYAIALGVGLFAWAVARWIIAERANWNRESWRRQWPCALLWLACVCAGLSAQRFGYRIVEDEVLLVGTSAQMYSGHEVGYASRAYDLGDGFKSIEVGIDKRPMLYPFLVSLLHDLTGYRVENAFALNAVVFGVTLALAMALGRKMGGVWGGRLAMVSLFSVPLLAEQSMGAGFDVLNLAMILAVTLCSWLYLEKPSDERLMVLVFAALLLVQTRYESGLFAFFAAVVIVLAARKERRVRLPWLVTLAPLLLVHHVWLMRVIDPANAWQLNLVDVSHPAFGVAYVSDNIGHALNFFLSADGSSGNSLLLFLVGVPAVLFFMLIIRRHLARWWRESPGWIALVLFAAGCIVHLALMMLFRFGRFDEITVQRLSLPTHLLLVFSLLAVLAHTRQPVRGLRAGVWLFSVYAVTFSLPSLGLDEFGARNFAARRARWVDTFVAAQHDPQMLGVDNLTARVWLNRRVPCVTIDAVRENPGRLARHFSLHSFSNVYVSQAFFRDPDTGGWTVVPEDELGAGYRLETVGELRLTPVKMQRISRVVSVDPAVPPPPIDATRPPGPPIASLDRGGPFLPTWVTTLP